MTQAKNNVSTLKLKRHMGVRYKAAPLMKHKLLQVMIGREDRRVLNGRDRDRRRLFGRGKAKQAGTGIGEQNPLYGGSTNDR